MSIKRLFDFGDHFTQIPNTWIRDKRLSYKAKGLLTYILSHAAGYELTVEQIIEDSADGESAVRTGINELEKCGYLVRQRRRSGNRLGGYDYIVCEDCFTIPLPPGQQPATVTSL